MLGAVIALGACSSPPPPGATPAPEPLTIGTLVPTTGDLAHLGPEQSAGISLAVKEINAAGGVLGQPVTLVEGDSGDAYTTVASQTVDRELDKKVDAIVGATGSSVTMEVIDKVVGAGVVLVSPGDTSDKLSTYAAEGLYFRTVPPDVLQAKVLAGLLTAAGHRRVAVLHVRDVYGAGLTVDLSADVVSSGGRVVASVEYDGRGSATDFAAAVTQVRAARADAVVIVGGGESKAIIEELVRAGLGPSVVPLYLTDLNLSNTLLAGLPAGTLTGVVGTRAGAAPSAAFLDALAAQAPDLSDVGYAAQAYDAVMMIALAADAAGSTRSKAIAQQLLQVGDGPTPCTSYAACLTLVKAARTIAYVGAAGPVPLGANGTPTSGTIGVYRFGANGSYPLAAVDYVAGTVPLSTP